MHCTLHAVPLSLLLLVAVAKSQEPVDPAAAVRSHGVVAADGVVRGVGPDYTARFDPRGVEFTPALGAAAERPFPVRFTMESVRRGSHDVFVRTVDVAPAVDGEQVRYVHGRELVEVYDVRAEGVEQSFVFATKPVGTGDLVVRGAITTELPLAAASDVGVRYERPGVGGVTFGAVTGVDANGATARGSIRVTDNGDHVEWVLPASFVEHCAYPLVLDPLIGSVIAIGNVLGSPDELPSVAFDDASNSWFVVWSVPLSATTAEIRGQFVSNGGSLVGTSLVIAAEGDATVRPSVANIDATNRFVVAYKLHDTDLFGGVDTSTCVRSVLPGTGSMSAQVVVEQTPSLLVGEATEIVVGGDSRAGFLGSSQNALVVLRKGSSIFGTLRKIVGHLVHVPASGNPTVGTSQSYLETADSIGEIAVTAHAGFGYWLVAWCRGVGASAPFTRVEGQLVFDTGIPCGATIPVYSTTTTVGRPSAATSTGAHFAVAWEDDVALGIKVRTMTWAGSCGAGTMTLGPIGNPLSPGLDTQPALGFARDKYVIAWRRSSLVGPATVRVKGLDADLCAACGLEYALDTAALSCDTPTLATQWQGGDSTNDEVLVVWSNGTIRGRRFEARSNDVVTAMGGACSASGFNDFATYNGDAVLGATDFELALASPVSLPLILVLGFGNLSAPCGSCTIVPTLDILLPAINPYPLAIPCDPLLVGVDLYTQWVLLKPSDCPILPDLAFSNALRFTIGE
jgi:hypothetical protein